MEALRPTVLEVGWIQGAPDGRNVPHFHARLVPRFRDDPSGTPALGEGEHREHLADVAAIVRGKRADPRRARASRLVPLRITALGAAGGDDDR